VNPLNRPYSVNRVNGLGILLILQIIFVVVHPVFAQDKKPEKAAKANYALANKVTTENLQKLVYDLRVQPHWFENSDLFWYKFKTNRGTHYYIIDTEAQSKKPLFDREKLSSQLTLIMTKPYNSKDLDLKNLQFSKNNTAIVFEIDSLRFEYSLTAETAAFLDTVKSPPISDNWKTFSPDSSWVVFAKDHDLFLMKAGDPDSIEIQLTTDGERWYSYAADEGDTTASKRIRSRAIWFGDSRKLYVEKRDARSTGDLFLINSLSKPRPTLETYKYPLPGEKNIPQEELIVFDVETRKRVDIDVQKWKDQALGVGYFGMNSGIYTINTSDKIYFQRINRLWNKIDFCAGNTETGEITTLISEESNPYINFQLIQAAILHDGEEIIWWSERDGWGHLYLYDGSGNQKNRITEGTFVVGAISKIDTTNRIVYFTGYGREDGIDPFYTLYYKVGFDGKNLRLLTPENATHSFDMSESRRFFVDTYSRIDKEPHSVLRDNNGNIILELETTDISRLNGTGWKMPETFIVKAADNITDLYGVMWKPFDFNPEKKYPLIAYCYPGPQSDPVPKAFTISGSRGRNVALAQLGFIVITVGNRGGFMLRSKYYHNFGYGNFRDYPLADNKYAIEQLADRFGFIDIDRVGIYGHSGGGFMSTAAILTYPDFYKVAVSSSGNHDNNIYQIYWSEIHSGVKEVMKKKKEGEETEYETVFKATVPANQELAKNLKGHLLLVTGDIDNNVHPAGTIRMANALIEAGKRFDFMILPGQRHGFSGIYGNYFIRMTWDYFAEHLLGDYRSNVAM